MVIRVTKCGAKNFSKMIVFPLISGVAMVLCLFSLKATVPIGITELFLLISVGILTYISITYLLDKFLNYRIGQLIREGLATLKGT